MKKIFIFIILLLCFSQMIFSAIGDSYEPELLTAVMDENVLICLPGINIGVTSMKVNTAPKVVIKSKNGNNFKIIKFTTISLKEAITADNKVLSYTVINYTMKEKGLFKINNLINKGSILFLKILKTMKEDDFTKELKGSQNAPDPKKFTKLRSVIVYNFIVEDSNKKQFPLQIFVESFKESSELK